MDKTIVVFRFFHGEVIALFPEIPATNSGFYCSSYAHVGQHGSADYCHVVSKSRVATSEEYAELKKELEAIGYDLDIRQKCSFKIHNERVKLAREAAFQN